MNELFPAEVQTDGSNEVPVSVRPEPRRNGFIRLGNIRHILGGDETTEVLEPLKIAEANQRHSLRRLGLPAVRNTL